jgi:DNA-binding SARP family transcriptional activator/tetratricopeptide (TPR) repeat protein
VEAWRDGMGGRRPAGALDVRLFGDVEVAVGGSRIGAFASPRLQSLLALLVVNRDCPLSRRRISFLFWPESSERQALTNLRQLLHQMRLALPEPERYLHVEQHTVQWRPDGPAEVDVARLEAIVEPGPEAVDDQALEQAAGLYRGDLLPALYDEWLVSERERLRRIAMAVFRELLGRASRRGAWDDAARSGDRLLRCDPLEESTYRRLMEVHVAAGDRARAVHVYHRCVSVLDRELGVAPDPSTVELYERMMAAGPNRANSSLARTEVPSASWPVFGRDEEARRLAALCEQAQSGRPALALIVGEAGIGKSRLMAELRLWCQLHGVVTVGSRAYEAEGALPYGPLVDVLRSDGVATSLRRLDAVWRHELVRIVPEIDTGFEHHGPPALDRETGRRRLFEAIARAVLHTERPMALAIDDVQWCDADSLDVLEFIMRVALQHRSPLLVVITARDDELASRPGLRSMLSRLHALDVVTELPLGRLERSDAVALASAVLGSEATEAAVERVVADAEGNPLFVVEMARSDLARRPEGGRDQDRIPPRVHAVIQARLDRLSQDARDVASAAAVVGRTFTPELVSRVLGDHDEDAAVDELWRRGIVRETEGEVYDFTHDKIRETAYLALGPARRQRLHAAVAAALLGDERGVVEPAQVAVHLERGGRPDAALAQYERAVAASAHVFAYQDMITHCRRAMDLVARRAAGPARDELELRFLLPLGVALHAGPGHTETDRAVYERARTLRTRRGLAPDPSTLRLAANAAITVRDFIEAHRFGQLLLEHGVRVDDAVVITEGNYLLGVTSFWLGELRASRRHLAEALAAYRPERLSEHLDHYGQDPRAVCLVRLALTLFYLGEHAEAARRCEDALRVASDIGHAFTQLYVEMFAAWYLAESGSAGRAALLADGMPAACSTNVLHVVAQTLFSGWSHTARGEPARGIPLLETACRDAREHQRTLEPYGLLMLAQARGLAGHPAAGLADATTARTIAAAEMPIHMPEADRLCGELLLAAGGAAAEAVAGLERATDTAVRQANIVHELRARTALLGVLRRYKPSDAEPQQRALRRLCGRFPPDTCSAEFTAARQALS